MRIFRAMKTAFCSFFAILLPQALFAQNITMPTITTIPSPTVGGGIYSPYSRTNPAYGFTNQSPAAQEAETGASLGNQSSSEEKKTADTLSSLTASEIATMGNLGLLSGLGSSGAAGETAVTGRSTNTMLRQLLGEMEEIKKQNEEATANAKKNATSETPAAEIVVPAGKALERTVSARKDSPHSRLLRFNVNGYDVLRTCRTVYISDMHADGSFLVTGDRRYMSDGKVRSETFHMLFTTDKNNEDSSCYSAAAEVNQDYFNQYSFLYELSQRNDLTAFRTGNLVTMRTSDPQWKLDLLIDLGE